MNVVIGIVIASGGTVFGVLIAGLLGSAARGDQMQETRVWVDTAWELADRLAKAPAPDGMPRHSSAAAELAGAQLTATVRSGSRDGRATR